MLEGICDYAARIDPTPPNTKLLSPRLQTPTQTAGGLSLKTKIRSSNEFKFYRLQTTVYSLTPYLRIMKRLLPLFIAALFFACGSDDSRPQFHPDAEALQIEALKVYHRKPDSALSVLDKAVQMDPSFYLAYNTKAMILIEKGDDAKAIAELHKSLHWRDDQPEVYLQLGMLNDRQNIPERAQDLFLRAKAGFDMRLAEDSPYKVQDEANRAITEIMLGETEVGNAALDSLIAEHPDHRFLNDIADRRAKARDVQVFDKAFYISALLD